jgi:hypothetical protein
MLLLRVCTRASDELSHSRSTTPFTLDISTFRMNTWIIHWEQESMDRNQCGSIHGASLAEDRMVIRSVGLFLCPNPSRREALKDDNREYGGTD